MGFKEESISVADYHIHPDFSFDASGSIDEYCQAALSKGLSEICFTTHYDINPAISDKERMIRIKGEMVPHSVENMQIYRDACNDAHDKYYELGLSVKCGVEFAYFPGCEDKMRQLLDKVKFHYRLGSIHEVGDCFVCYKESMKRHSEKTSLADFADSYFDLMTKMVESGLCDAVSHLDLYRQHGIELYGDKILKIHEGRVEPLFETMRDRDVGFEINTKAVRRGLEEYYPAMTIVNIARKIGARIVAIGSDAHKPDEVAHEFDMAAAVAYDLFPYVDE